MSSSIFEPDILRRLTELEDQSKRLASRVTSSSPFQVLGNGLPFFPSGVEMGGGGKVRIFEPAILPPPTNAAATSGAVGNRIYIDVSWTGSAGYGDDQIAAYLVQIVKDGEIVPIETTVQSGVNFTRFEPVEPMTKYNVQVAAVSRNGRNSTSSTTFVITGRDMVPPAAPTGVTVTPGVTSLLVKWAANTEADVANGAGTYRLRVSTASNLSAPVFDQMVSGTVGYVPGLVAGTNYYVGLQAVDSSGNQSTTTTPSGGPWTPAAITSTDLALSIGGGNIVRNSGFEDGLNSWTATSGCTVLIGNSHGAFGTHALQIAGTGDDYAYQNLDLSQGTWVISVWSKASAVTGAGQGVVLNWSTVSGTINAPTVLMGGTSDSGRVVAGKGTWEYKRLAFSVTVTSPTAQIRVQPQRGYGGTCSGTAWFDEVQAEMGSTITAYAPRADELTTGSVTATIIADNAITSPKIVAGAVIAGKIAANAIGANEIQAASITGAKIAADTLTANNIAAGAITADELAANSVTATKIAASSITASKIAAGTITADRLSVTTTLAVGQSIQSSNFVAGSTGWRIPGDGNAEFGNVTIRNSTFVGGVINVSGKILVNNAGGDVHVFSNLEIGSNYSGTLYSGAPVGGGGYFGLQIGNDGISGGQVWTHLGAPVSGNGNWYVAMFDSYSNKRVWYANSNLDTWNPGPQGRIFAEKRDMGLDWANSAFIIQNGGPNGGNSDQATMSFHVPDHGVASMIKLQGAISQDIEFRNSTDSAFVGIKASAFFVNSTASSKRNIKAIDKAVSEKLSKLKPVTFNREGAVCSYCDDTGKVTSEKLYRPGQDLGNVEENEPLNIGDDCPLCNGIPGQGKARRPAGAKKTQDSPFYGLVAEEVAEQFPEAVSWVGTTDADLKPDSIDYSAIVALLVLRVQNLEKEIATVKGRP